jgi:hypothetical protein
MRLEVPRLTSTDIETPIPPPLHELEEAVMEEV